MANIRNITSNFTEAERLLQYKQDGKLDVLASLYEPYMDNVYGVCMKYLQNAEDAQDAVINIFEELVEKVKKYEIENFPGWLYQLARNHCLMKLRKEKNRPRVVELPVMQFSEVSHLDDVVEKEKSFNKLEHCLEKLNEEQKNAVRMFYLEDKCYKEIEVLTGLDSNKVRSFIQNGRRNLKICMEENENE